MLMPVMLSVIGSCGVGEHIDDVYPGGEKLVWAPAASEPIRCLDCGIDMRHLADCCGFREEEGVR